MIPEIQTNLPGLTGKPDPQALQSKIESMFTETMLKTMEDTVDAEDGYFGNGVSSDIYRGMVREQLATNLTSFAFQGFNKANPVKTDQPPAGSSPAISIPDPTVLAGMQLKMQE